MYRTFTCVVSSSPSSPPFSKVNMGEQMEIFTGGLFPATRHRVVIPEAAATAGDSGSSGIGSRQSFAFFVHADDEVVLAPAIGGGVGGGVGMGVGGETSSSSSGVRRITAKMHTEERFAATYGDRFDPDGGVPGVPGGGPRGGPRVGRK